MFSKRELEGYLLIDHRNSPGITPQEAAKAGKGTVPIGKGTMFESATINCSHCSSLIVLNPDRSRSRGYCPKCDHYVCDGCESVRAVTGECYPMKRRIDEFIDNASKIII